MGLERNKTERTGTDAAGVLVGKVGLLEAIFPIEADRPTTKWLDTHCKRREIPFIKVGRLVWFDVAQVRAALQQRHGVGARK